MCAQLVGATEDGKPFDGEDAQLKLSEGTPRFYIMHLPRKGLVFDRITYHAKVSQCLGERTIPVVNERVPSSRGDR